MSILSIPQTALIQPARKTITFTGATNLGEAGTNATVFTVTGQIHVVSLVPYCTTNLGEALATATVSLGTTATVALFIAATNSVDIDANEVWTAAAPTTRSLAIPAALKDIAVNNNIIVACATQNTNAGVIDFTMTWYPLSAGATVT